MASNDDKLSDIQFLSLNPDKKPRRKSSPAIETMYLQHTPFQPEPKYISVKSGKPFNRRSEMEFVRSESHRSYKDLIRSRGGQETIDESTNTIKSDSSFQDFPNRMSERYRLVDPNRYERYSSKSKKETSIKPSVIHEQSLLLSTSSRSGMSKSKNPTTLIHEPSLFASTSSGSRISEPKPEKLRPGSADELRRKQIIGKRRVTIENVNPVSLKSVEGCPRILNEFSTVLIPEIKTEKFQVIAEAKNSSITDTKKPQKVEVKKEAINENSSTSELKETLIQKNSLSSKVLTSEIKSETCKVIAKAKTSSITDTKEPQKEEEKKRDLNDNSSTTKLKESLVAKKLALIRSRVDLLKERVDKMEDGNTRYKQWIHIKMKLLCCEAELDDIECADNDDIRTLRRQLRKDIRDTINSLNSIELAE